MHDYDEVVQMAKEKGYDTEVHELNADLVKRMERLDPGFYQKYMDEMCKLAYKIPQDEAERIVKAMRPRGQYWSYNQIKDYLAEKGIDKDCVTWYLVMNMTYNDNYDTAKAYGHQNDVEFFFHLAKDFIEDPDAKPYKVEKYFT